MKLYLLLRKNSLSGPYALDIIRSMDLLTSDLIWIEGTSTAWIESSAIDELKDVVRPEDEDEILKRRAALSTKGKKSSIAGSIHLFESNLEFLNASGKTDFLFLHHSGTSLRYTAPYFKERQVPDMIRQEIWIKPKNNLANLINVTLVFLTVSFGAFIIQQLVEGYENNVVIITGKDYPVKKMQTIELNAPPLQKSVSISR